MFERSQPQARPNAVLVARFQRTKRVVTFTGELARALAGEFALPPGAKQTAPLSQLAPLDRDLAIFRAELAEVLQLVEAGEKLVKEAPAMGDLPAMQALTAFDPTLAKITRLGSGLEAKAKALRGQLEARAAASAPQARARGTNPLQWVEKAETSKLGQSQVGQQMLGALKKLAASPAVTQQSAAPSGPPPLPPAVLKARQAFDRAFKFSGQVLAYVSPRLSAVRVALGLTGLPGKPRPPEEAKAAAPEAIVKGRVPPEFRPHVGPIMARVYADTAAVRLAHAATVQWDEALKVRGDAEILKSAMNQAPEERLVTLLAEMHPGKIEAAVVPLSHLHVTFKDVSPLAALFPPPEPSKG